MMSKSFITFIFVKTYILHEFGYIYIEKYCILFFQHLHFYQYIGCTMNGGDSTITFWFLSIKIKLNDLTWRQYNL